MAASRVSNRWPTGLLVAVSLLWGSTWVANSMLAEPDAPLHTAALRYVLAFICVAVIQILLARRVRHQPPKERPVASGSPERPSTDPTLLSPLELLAGQRTRWISASICLGCTMFAIPDLLLVWSAHHGSAPWTPLIYAGLPLGLLLASGELSAAPTLGLGAMLVLLNGSLPLSPSKLSWALLIVAAVGLQGWSLIYAKRHIATVASFRGVMVQLATAGGALAVADRLWPAPGARIALRDWPASSLGALCVLAGLATALAYPVYYRLLAHLQPAQLAVSAWLQTLVAVGESAWLSRHRPGWMMGVAACVLVGCAVSMLRSSRANGEDLRLQS